MNKDNLNIEVRKFLKKVGISSQRIIETSLISKFENGDIDTDDRFVWRQLGVEVYNKLLGTVQLEKI